MQTVFTSPYVSIWWLGFLLLHILEPNPGRPAPPMGWKQRTTILSLQGLLSCLILSWAVLVLLSSWRFWGCVCQGVWLKFKPGARFQKTPFLLARSCLLIVFRDPFSLFASVTSLPSACLPFGHFTYHHQTLELSLSRNCRIWCRIFFSPQLLFLGCFLFLTLLFFTTSHCWLLGLPQNDVGPWIPLFVEVLH